MFTNNEETLAELKEKDPYMFEELTLKRSNSFKDPAKNRSSTAHTKSSWNLLNHCPSRQIEKVIRPKILHMDAEGCGSIIKRLNDDKILQDL